MGTNLTATPSNEVDLTTPETRRAAFKAFETLTVQAVVGMATVLKAMVEAGDDTEWIDSNRKALLLKIADRQVLPEVMCCNFGEQARRQISQLPMQDQQRLVGTENNQVELAVIVGGTVTHKLYRPAQLSREQVKQVFANGSIRSIAEQAAWLDSQGLKTIKLNPSVRGRADKRNGGAFFGKLFVAQDELERLVRSLQE